MEAEASAGGSMPKRKRSSSGKVGRRVPQRPEPILTRPQRNAQQAELRQYLADFVTFAKGEASLSAYEANFVSSMQRLLSIAYHHDIRFSDKQRAKLEEIRAIVERGSLPEIDPDTAAFVEADIDSDEIAPMQVGAFYVGEDDHVSVP